jgi:O-acetyl-ADP-ribose deacetylase (regulator of RNase III)
MLTNGHGDLLTADAEALVNTVNTAGIMGKGIALQFKQAYPGNFRAYEAACRRGEVRLGAMFTYETGLMENPRFIVNFPTKGHWRSRSRLDDIRSGLADLRSVILDRGIRSIAIPPLGCGNGGLDWREVRPVIAEALGDLPDVEVRIYPPQGAPPAETMTVRTERPRMTAGRAALLTATGRYCRLAVIEQVAELEGASLLEIQKLMYFLQEAGQSLRLSYVKARYGPYAENLNHVLQALEGHYIRGYGDRTRQVLDLSPITLTADAEDEAADWLAGHPDETTDRIDKVMHLAAGFASAYGLELLATVHWIATREASTIQAGGPKEIKQLIGTWSDRKGRLFTEAHVAKAADHLHDLGWVPSA